MQLVDWVALPVNLWNLTPVYSLPETHQQSASDLLLVLEYL